MKALIGVDIGTQGTKAAIYTAAGERLASAFKASRLLRPRAGHVEEDPDDQFAAVCWTIRKCIADAGIDRDDVAAVAIDGQMAGVIGVGADGRHVTPYDSWLDGRCSTYINPLCDACGDEVIQKTGCAPSINHGPKILWWKHERPREYRKIVAFVQPGGYAAMRLCGLSGAQAFIDSTYLHFSAFADNRRMTWDASLCKAAKVEMDKLPRIVQPQEIVGRVTKEVAAKCGLKAGTPVVAGCGDTAASFLAAGAVAPGICVDVAGTASVFATTTATFEPDKGHRMMAVGRSAVPGLWHPYAYINGGGMNLEWFRNDIAGLSGKAKPTFDELNAAAVHLGDITADAPLFIPHMEGRVRPSQPNLRGAWIGLNWSHTAAHLHRSTMEAVALEYALYRDALKGLYPETAFKELHVTGGGAASTLWNTIKADVLQMPLRPVASSDGAPRGAAMLAGWAVGLLKDLPSAAKTWVKTGQRVSPRKRMARVYHNRVARYRAALAALSSDEVAGQSNRLRQTMSTTMTQTIPAALQASPSMDFPPATKPTIYFIGVTTGKSSIMKVFPKWAEHLKFGDVQIVGIDCKLHDDPATYRRVVSHIKSDPLSLGALVTTHKLDLLKACRDLFDTLDPWASLIGEVSSISKRDGRLVGHAKDPITSGLSLEAFIRPGYWQETGAHLCLLGAGGSSQALSCYLLENGRTERPKRIVMTARSQHRLDESRHLHDKMGRSIKIDYVLAPTAADNDKVVATLPPGSVVANATGLGKDAPGSPLTDAVVFPRNGYAWDFNYRGDLVFLDQARAQGKQQHLTIEDGWVYFLHGWTRVVAEVFNVDIPTSGPKFDALSDIARNVR